jgi:hypothetical protein
MEAWKVASIVFKIMRRKTPRNRAEWAQNVTESPYLAGLLSDFKKT